MPTTAQLIVLSLALRPPEAWCLPSHGGNGISGQQETKAEISQEAPSLESSGGVSRVHSIPPPTSWPFSTSWRFSDSMSRWKLLTLHSLPCPSLLTPTKDWNWLSAPGLATVIAAFVNKLRIYRNPLFAVSTLCTWEQWKGSAGNPWLRIHKRASE